MIFVGDIANKPLSERVGTVLGTGVVYVDKHVFADGEQRVRIENEVLDADIVILKSISYPVDSNILEFLFTIDALKRAGARSVTAIVPYLGYSRADHVFRSGEAVPLEVVIRAIESCGLDEIILIDPHTIKLPEMFSIRCRAVSALPLARDIIHDLGIKPESLSIVSPDMGGIRRVKQLVDMLPGATYAAINKDRDLATGELTNTHVAEGEVRDVCFITDDIISTGGTVVNAVELLKSQGKDVYVFATQPVFSGDAVEKLRDSQVQIYVTDAIFLPSEKQFDTLTVVPLASLISEIFA